MKPSFFNSYFQFTKAQRSGIFALLLLVSVLQAVRYFFDITSDKGKPTSKQQWISTQIYRDSLQSPMNHNKWKLRPFNPNFINDFKGYQLGMSVSEIDRLLAFRKGNRFVNSAAEFQAVTKISDSLLHKIAPLFKFPAWVSNKAHWKSNYERPKIEQKIVQIDINEATAEDLKKIYGIGDGLSERILKEKRKFGAFVSMDQLNDIYGLSSEVIEELNKRFKVNSEVTRKRININTATIKELMQLPYFRYPVAKAIVAHRSMNGQFVKIADLTNISGFPNDRIEIIALYLEF